MEEFSHIVKQGWKQFLADNVNSRLKSALNVSEVSSEEGNKVSNLEEMDEKEGDNGIVTTEEEVDAFHIVKAILREVVDVKRIVMRDTKSYCGILLDNNNRKPICRLHFNYAQKYIGVLSNKNEDRIPIDGIDDIFNHADRIKNVLAEYSAA